MTMVGFAKRSGKIVYGYDSLKSARGIKLMAVSSTASDNLKSSMELLAQKKRCPLVTAVALEDKVGNNVKALGLTDANMANAIEEYIVTGDSEYSIKNGVRR